MSDLVNPYHAGRPVEGSEIFFGRDDALIWIEQQITLDRRFLFIHGPDLIGKTSLVRRLPTFLSEHVYCLYFECKPHQKKPLPQVLAALAGELADQLLAHGLVSPHQVDTAADSAAAVKSLLAHASEALEGRRLLMVMDDVHRLTHDESPLLDGFLDVSTTMLAEVPFLQLLLTLSDLSYAQLDHPILLGAMTFRLGPLTSDAAQQLITRPAQGALRFDAGVVKRITEITSNHPYYIHLFCYTLYNFCAREGWINHSDLDRVLETLLTLPNEKFQAAWDWSNKAEQAALAALAGRKGAHGPVTRQEVINYLRRFAPEVNPDVILNALESLVERGVLVRMGALSYRFSVNLFRYWLDFHTDPAQVVAGIDWGRLSDQLASRIPPEEVDLVQYAPTDGEIGQKEERSGWNLGRISVLGLTGTALIGTVLLALAFGGVLPPVDTVDATQTASSHQLPASFASPVPSPTFTLVPTPTPTRPLVVAHSLPAIVYMAQGVDDTIPPLTWQLFVTNANGSNSRQLIESDADDITPGWSPDAQRIAFVSQRDGNREIYLANTNLLAGRGSIGLFNLTEDPSEDWTPAWSPDGRQIAFSSNRRGNWEIFIVNADGTELRQITNDGGGNLSPVWSPDGQTLAYASKRDGDWEIHTMPAPDQGVGTPRRLTFSEGNDLSPLFSPQGDRIAFESNREGNVEIYVMNVDGSDQRNLSNLIFADDHGPVWSPDGQRLIFYSNREGNWDLFLMTSTGENVVNLTNTRELNEQAPAWRP